MNIIARMTQPRNKTLDIAKGIGIVLMVIGHSGCPTLLCNFIYLFHMPLFFFISGYLAYEGIYTKENNNRQWLKRKTYKLYLPFVIISYVFFFWHNTLYELNLESIRYSTKNIINKIIEIPLLLGSDSLIAGFWFISCLFYSFIAIYGLRLLSKRLSTKKILALQILFSYTFFEIVLCIRKWTSGYGEPYNFITDYIVSLMSALVFVSLGMVFAHNGIKRLNMSISIYIGLCVLLAASIFMPIYRPYDDVLWGGYVVAMGLLGTLVSLKCSELLQNSVWGYCLSRIGRHTLIILTLHLLSFKAISFLYILSNHIALSRLSEYPVVTAFSKEGGWIVYSIFGVVIPISLFYFFKSLLRQYQVNF